MNLTIHQKSDNFPINEIERSPVKPVFITASPIRVWNDLPLSILQQMSPEQIAIRKQVSENDGFAFPEHIPDDPEASELLPEIAVLAIRHPKMVIEEADEVVLDAPEAELLLYYPLSVIVSLPLKAVGSGITRREILNVIHDAYMQIYREEERVSRPENSEDQGELSLNRTETKGPYGIFGHVLRDLVVERINIYHHKGRYFIIPAIES